MPEVADKPYALVAREPLVVAVVVSVANVMRFTVDLLVLDKPAK